MRNRNNIVTILAIVIILAFFIPVVSMFGDLIASTIKRNYGKPLSCDT